MKKILVLLLLLSPIAANAANYRLNYRAQLDGEDRVCLGAVEGVTCVNKFGRSTNVDATLTDIWDGSGDTTPIVEISSLSTAGTIKVWSASALDDDGAAGCNSIGLYGVKGDFTRASETVTLDGQTYVDTVESYLGVDRLDCETAGNSATQVGNIYAASRVDDSTQAMITAGAILANRTLMAIYYVASDESFSINQYYADINKASGSTAYADIQLVVRDRATTANSPFKVRHYKSVTSGGSSSMVHPFDVPEVIEGPAVVKIRALGSTANLDVTAGFGGYTIQKVE